MSDHEDDKEADMAIMLVADDAPLESTTTQPSDPPPVKEEAPLMEVDEGNGDKPPVSPVSPKENEILMGSGATGMEGEMANLKVSSPKDQEDGDEDAPI